MEGWEAPIQQEIEINPIEKMTREEIIAEIERIERCMQNPW